MFKRKEDKSPELETSSPQQRVTSVLGSGMSWTGELSGEGGVRIEGAFEGKIDIDGLVVVDRKGRVTSESVHASSVVVEGTVRSDIQAERIEIRSTGRVWGNVVTKSLSTEEGAYLRGKIEMEEGPEEAEGELDSSDDEPASEEEKDEE